MDGRWPWAEPLRLPRNPLAGLGSAVASCRSHTSQDVVAPGLEVGAEDRASRSPRPTWEVVAFEQPAPAGWWRLLIGMCGRRGSAPRARRPPGDSNGSAGPGCCWRRRQSRPSCPPRSWAVMHRAGWSKSRANVRPATGHRRTSWAMGGLMVASRRTQSCGPASASAPACRRRSRSSPAGRQAGEPSGRP